MAVALLLGSLGLFPLLGKSFMPTMKEGALTPQINRVPSISLDESIRILEACSEEDVQALPKSKHMERSKCVDELRALLKKLSASLAGLENFLRRNFSPVIY